jgi:hypothetical protein
VSRTKIRILRFNGDRPEHRHVLSSLAEISWIIEAENFFLDGPRRIEISDYFRTDHPTAFIVIRINFTVEYETQFDFSTAPAAGYFSKRCGNRPE